MKSFVIDSAGVANIDKDPNDILDYSIDWNAWLVSANNDAISTSTWTADTGVTLASQSVAAGISTVFISGGAAGSAYKVNCKIVTNASPPRTIERGFTVNVKEL